MTVVGQVGQNSAFLHGTGSSCSFDSNIGEIYSHPLVDNFFFVNDDNGIRVLCM